MAIYRFAQFSLDTERHELHGPEGEIPLRPMARELLCLLLEQAHRAVTREEIQQKLWPDLHVDPNSLTQLISELRKIFRDETPDTVFIKTIPKIGYQWSCETLTEEDSCSGKCPSGRSSTRSTFGARSRMWWPLIAITIATASVFIGWFGVSRPHIPFRATPDTPTLLLLPFLNETRNPDLDWLELGFMDMISTDMSQRALNTIDTVQLVPAWQSGALRFDKEVLSDQDLERLQTRFPNTFLIHTTFRKEASLLIFRFHFYEQGRYVTRRVVRVKNPAEAATEISRTLLSQLKIRSGSSFGRGVFHPHGFINESFAKGLQWFYFGETQKALHYFDICLLQDPTWRMGRLFKATALQRLGDQSQALLIAESLLRDITEDTDGDGKIGPSPTPQSTVEAGVVHFLMADILLGLRRLEDAAEHIEAARNRLQKPGRKAQLLVLGGSLFTLMGRLDQARAMYANALEIYTDLNSVDGRALVHMNLGQLHLRMNDDPETVERHLLKANELAQIMGNQSIQSYCLMQLGGQLATREPARAVAFLEEALRIKRSLGERRSVAIALDYLGDIYTQERQLDAALTHLQEALEIWRSIDDPYNLVNSLLLHVNFFVARGDHQQARAFLQEAAQICDRQQDHEGMALVQLGMWEVAIMEGDVEEAGRVLDAAVALLEKSPPYLSLALDCYTAAQAYKQEKADIARDILSRVKVQLTPQQWTETQQQYLDLYAQTVETGQYEPLPMETQPKLRPY